MKIFPYLKLIRPANVIITFFSVIVAIIISTDAKIPIEIFLFSSLSAAFTAAAGNIINDYFDIETDRVNKPGRPLANGVIEKNNAAIFYISLNIVSLIIAAYISLVPFLIVLFVQIILLLYSFRLKKIPLLGNIVIAFLTGLVFIYGGTVTGNINNLIIPAVFAFLINLIRELLKDIEDMKGDIFAGIKTLPIIKGINFSKWIIFFLTIILIFFTFHLFLYKYYKIEFIIIIMAAVNPLLVYFLKSFFEDQSPGNLKKLSNLLKLSMVIGLIAIFAGK